MARVRKPEQFFWEAKSFLSHPTIDISDNLRDYIRYFQVSLLHECGRLCEGSNMISSMRFGTDLTNFGEQYTISPYLALTRDTKKSSLPLLFKSPFEYKLSQLFPENKTKVLISDSELGLIQKKHYFKTNSLDSFEEISKKLLHYLHLIKTGNCFELTQQLQSSLFVSLGNTFEKPFYVKKQKLEERVA